MASVVECIVKLEAAGTITRAVATEAREFFNRSKAEWSREMGPASADAAAALETAKKLRDKAAENQIAIAADVKRWQTIEKRIVEDPRGRNAAVAGALSKDTLLGDGRLSDLRKSEPDHPIFSDGNADYRGREIKRQFIGMLGTSLEKFKAGLFKSKTVQLGLARDFINERFGVDTGNADAKSVSDGFGTMADAGVQRAKAAGKVFEEREDWRVPQHWTPRRVAKVDEATYVKDHLDEVANGGLKLFDKETNRYATAARYEEILKKAYSDIKTEGGSDAPFSKNGRTFEFQDGQAGSDSWWKLQQKYGVGNEVIGSIINHVDHMARTIALHETFGAHPDAVFAAAMRLVKDEPSVPVKGFGWMTSDTTLKNTYNLLSGRGHPIASETWARRMAGIRDLVGMASLRNLPITIIPGDAAMTMLSQAFQGMSGLNVLGHVFSGMTKETAAHLQISAHGHMDFINNFARRYEDEINVSGLVRKASRTVVKATGAEMWTTNGRLSYPVSQLNQLAGMRDIPFDRLDPGVRDNFLRHYGFTAEDWDKIRTPDVFEAPNGAKYIEPSNLERPIMERLMMAIDERASFAFHQPDTRTQALMQFGQPVTRGSLGGEIILSMGQYKQFTMERMTTHLMRVLTDGSGYTDSPTWNRINRGLAFTVLSAGAGAVSLQAGAIVTGKNPLDMTHPKFWAEAFARGGAGGIYGDVLNAAIHGDRGGVNMAAQFMGPIPGFLGDTAGLAFNPARRELDESGRQSKATAGGDTVAFGRRWSPTTWYAKLAVDRLLWDKLQILVDPNYRQSFRRAEQRAKKDGSGYWWSPGQGAPSGPPGMAH